ncbi:RNA polymerase sigma-70 factor [Microbacterium amylolyticum]|uniref:RNA polymerase sigma-70 factor (ECF subfamily) n=1 Tax=Microbacterium amylolyticum TaxID=936337 RepID=A0ABS4ZIA1_9MICO|nr:RNA polymerase sigma-70 factor [Microbacterium amylolyticum]MBP2436725.1 RNA polymerase sigma-70 factor (ECF subfamily) [Microbacterium amylolyticum]
MSSDAFSDHRRLLFTIAYEILGSVADAEDVVQEAWLRWNDADRSAVRDERAYLARIATRLSLNRLRTLARRREDYVGPWLPEPLITRGDVADDVVLAENVSTAMMLVLETLQPIERAVFVLREVFGFEHREIADAVERTPEAVRQIAHRARGHVEARRPRTTVDAQEAARVVERFRIAAETGDLQGLVDVLAPDVVFLSDGGGNVTAARRPIIGADNVIRFIAGLLEQNPGSAVEAAEVNGTAGLRALVGDAVDGVISFSVDAGVIREMYYVRNPEKLARLRTHNLIGR